MSAALTRSIGEKLLIGDNIVVSVLAVYGDIVRLGVSADPQIPVQREEVWKRLQLRQQAPLASDPVKRRSA